MSVRSDNVSFNWQDPFLMEEQLNEEERMVRDTAKQYAQEKGHPLYDSNIKTLSEILSFM